jgi:hypothetical protein
VERPFPAYKGDAPYIFVSYPHDDAALVNRSDDADNEYLCDGITEELIGGLSKVEDGATLPHISAETRNILQIVRLIP